MWPRRLASPCPCPSPCSRSRRLLSPGALPGEPVISGSSSCGQHGLTDAAPHRSPVSSSRSQLKATSDKTSLSSNLARAGCGGTWEGSCASVPLGTLCCDLFNPLPSPTRRSPFQGTRLSGRSPVFPQHLAQSLAHSWGLN